MQVGALILFIDSAIFASMTERIAHVTDGADPHSADRMSFHRSCEPADVGPTETRPETAPARSAAKDLSGCIPWCGRHAERCCTGNLQNFAASAL
jgi:hypothetical protein